MTRITTAPGNGQGTHQACNMLLKNHLRRAARSVNSPVQRLLSTPIGATGTRTSRQERAMALGFLYKCSGCGKRFKVYVPKQKLFRSIMG